MSDKLYKSLPESAVELEEALLVRWDEEGTFQLSLDATRDGERFVFYEGPPRQTAGRVSITSFRVRSKTRSAATTR